MDFMNNPNWIAGLANMRGGDPQEALLEHAKMQESQVRQRAAEQEMARNEQEFKRQEMIESQSSEVLKNLAGKPKSERIDLLRGVGYKLKEALKFDNDMFGSGEGTSKMQTYNYYKELPPEEQKSFLRLQRADKYIDRGSEVVGVDPTTGEVASTFAKDLAPEQEPEHMKEAAAASKEGTELGEARTKFKSLSSKLPELKETLGELDTLSEKATYTLAGQAGDFLVKQAGFGSTEGAEAKAEYLATVKNVVLPMLKDTFGAAFTATEGESLLATLGDSDMTPTEKKAVLKSKLSQYQKELKSLARQTGNKAASDVSQTDRQRLEADRARGK